MKITTAMQLLFMIVLIAGFGGCGGSGGSSSSTSYTVSMGTATLTWSAPTTRTDGSSINPAIAIQSYNVYYGTSSNTYTDLEIVANPGTASITQVLSLPRGATYYFVVTAIDTYGQESTDSNEASKRL